MIGFINRFNSQYPSLAVVFHGTGPTTWEHFSVCKAGFISHRFFHSLPLMRQHGGEGQSSEIVLLSTFSHCDFHLEDLLPDLPFLPHLAPHGCSTSYKIPPTSWPNDHSDLRWDLEVRSTWIVILLRADNGIFYWAFTMWADSCLMLNMFSFTLMVMLGGGWAYPHLLHRFENRLRGVVVTSPRFHGQQRAKQGFKPRPVWFPDPCFFQNLILLPLQRLLGFYKLQKEERWIALAISKWAQDKERNRRKCWHPEASRGQLLTTLWRLLLSARWACKDLLEGGKWLRPARAEVWEAICLLSRCSNQASD